MKADQNGTFKLQSGCSGAARRGGCVYLVFTQTLSLILHFLFSRRCIIYQKTAHLWAVFTHAGVVLLELDAAEMRSLLFDHIRYKLMYLQPDVTDHVTQQEKHLIVLSSPHVPVCCVFDSHMRADEDGLIHELIQRVRLGLEGLWSL